jgi:DNA-binding Xre family transcriptional regulator
MERDGSPATTDVATVLRFPRAGAPADERSDQRPGRRPGVREVMGDELRRERHRQARTLTDVAGAAAVSVPYLSEVERGRKEASSDVLEAICVALELPLPDLLERSAERLRGVAPRARAQGLGRCQLLAA